MEPKIAKFIEADSTLLVARGLGKWGDVDQSVQTVRLDLGPNVQCGDSN